MFWAYLRLFKHIYIRVVGEDNIYILNYYEFIRMETHPSIQSTLKWRTGSDEELFLFFYFCFSHAYHGNNSNNFTFI